MRDPKFLMREAYSLSAGTIGNLINCPRYTVIEEVQQDFAEFCEECPNYANWIEAWNAFIKLVDIQKRVSEILAQA